MNQLSYIFLSLLFLFMISCNNENRIPDTAKTINKPLKITPDYNEITIPPNMA